MNGFGNTDINSHYEQWDEKSRLFNGTGVLEYVRSQELIERYLPPSPATILDVGGGPGVYAYWLAECCDLKDMCS